MSSDVLIKPPEAERAEGFQEHNRNFLQRHEGEIVSRRETPPKVAIIFRGYSELSNGNLTDQLFSLSKQTIPASDFEAVFVINNPRFIAAAADIFQANPDLLPRYQRVVTLVDDYWRQHREEPGLSMRSQDLVAKVVEENPDLAEVVPSVTSALEEYFETNWWYYSSSELSNLDGIRRGALDLDTRVRGYQENQATIAILTHITQAANSIREVDSRLQRDEIIDGTLGNIRAAAAGLLTPHQLQTLTDAAKQTLNNGVRIVCVDSSSADKAYEDLNMGRNFNEGMHIAYSRGATILAPSDMDEFLAPQGLEEIVDVVEQGVPDIIIRPFKLITPQHPEQLREEDGWVSLMAFYHETYTQAAVGSYGQTANPKHTGQIIVSRRLFEEVEFPEVSNSEDFLFAQLTLDKVKKGRYYLTRPTSPLLLSERKRESSIDGHSFTRIQDMTPEALVDEYHRENLFQAREFRRTNDAVEQLLRNSVIEDAQGRPRNDDLLQYYRDQRRLLFENNQRERLLARTLFFGSEGDPNPQGIVQRLYSEWQRNQHVTTEDMIALSTLSVRQKAFLERNPLLIPALTREMGRNNLATVEEVVQFIEATLPEIFARPLDTEPNYKEDAGGSLSMDFVQIQMAKDTLYRQMNNMDQNGQLVIPDGNGQRDIQEFLRIGRLPALRR